MYVSAKSLRGLDHLWAKIWQSVTETPRGRRHRNIGMKELNRLYSKEGIPEENDLANLFGLTRAPAPVDVRSFDSDEFAEDEDFEPDLARKSQFDDMWGEELGEEDGFDDDDGDWDEWQDMRGTDSGREFTQGAEDVGSDE